MSIIFKHFKLMTVFMLALATLLASCSSSNNNGYTSSSSASNTTGNGGTKTSNVIEILLTKNPKLGEILTSASGRTLYHFDNDSVGVSTCNDGCAQIWPPFIVPKGDILKAGSGITGTLSTIKRANGQLQAAYNGLPLYFYSGDSAPGQTNGQGIEGLWFVVYGVKSS
jgi:predicted lipoprotein with Yx(FWY)xxD motif